MEAQQWEAQVAGMRPFIQKVVRESPLTIRDADQCVLEAELALWRRMASYDVAQPFRAWAKAVVRLAVRNFSFREREGHEDELLFSNLTEEETRDGGDELLEAWLAEHALGGALVVSNHAEEIVLRVSVEDFLTMIEERFGQNCRMLRAALGLLQGEDGVTLEKRLQENEREIKRIVKTNLRAVWERWERGQRL